MKILKVELQNINSLRTEEPIVIDFESDAFLDVGLFAITGPTGAGKTTILDAITIGLYRNVPRFQGGTSKAKLEDVVSYGAGAAFVNITFENKSEKYEAHWSIRLKSKSTGKLLGTPNETVRLKNLTTGKILAEKKNEMTAEVERITQLNYSQFLRSVMLAQGQFASFLSANASEKGALLEQITGEEIYKRIGELVGQKIYEEKNNLGRIRSEINERDLLSKEELKELELNQKDINNALNVDRKTREILQSRLDWFKNLEILNKEEAVNTRNIEELAETKKEHEEEFNTLEEHENAAPFQPLVNELTRVERELGVKENLLTIKRDELAIKNIELSSQEKKVEVALVQFSVEEKESENWHPKLEKVAKLDTEIQGGKETKEILFKQLSELSNGVKIASDSQSKYIKRIKALEEEKDVLNVFLQSHKKFAKMDQYADQWNTKLTLRKSKKAQVEAFKNGIEIKEKELESLEGQSEKQIEIVKKEENKIVPLEKESEKYTLELKTINGDNLSTQQQVLNDTISALKKGGEWMDSLQQKTKKGEALKKELAGFQKEVKKIENEDKKDAPLLKGAQLAVFDQEKIISQENKIIALEKERALLIEGQPCSLCGSTEHPLVAHYESIKPSSSESELTKRKEKLTVLENQKTKRTLDLNILKTKIEGVEKERKDLSTEITEIKKEFKTLKLEIPIDNKEAIERSLQDKSAALTVVLSTINKEKEVRYKKENAAQLLQKQIELLTSLKSQHKLIQEKQILISEQVKEETIKIEQITVEIIDLGDAVENELNEFDSEELTLPEVEDTERFLNQIQELIASIEKNKIAVLNKDNELALQRAELENTIDTLKEKQKEELKITDAFNKLTSEILSKEKERKGILPLEITTQEKRTMLQLKLEKAKDALEDSKLLEQKLKIAVTTLVELEKNLEKDGKELKESLVKLNGELEEKLESTNYDNKEDLASKLLSEEEFNGLSKWRDGIKEKEVGFIALKEKFIKDREKINTTKVADDSKDGLIEQLENSKQQIENAIARLGRIKTQFDLDNQIRERNSEVIGRITSQELILGKWTDLMNLLGGSKDKFNTYVQRLTLQNLIHLANVHLFKLNKRYSLKMMDAYKPGEELNFMLVDHYQTDEMRLVDTSSGGEKFIISLALALGLSDLASNNVHIGSLFIDEGFGTLDNNTLETVISTLETLQAQGKMIGIISHVENLKERIPTQIKVIKKSNGVSCVEID